jgi:hypothetical protein
MRGKQDSYHCQLESFHKQSKICLCIYIFILAPKFTKVFLHRGQAPLFSILSISLRYIYIEKFLCGIQNVQTSHNSKIRDELQGGMIYNNRYPILKGPLGTGSSYLGPFLRPPSVQNMLRCTYSSLRIYFSSTISSFRVTNQAG